MAIRSPSMRREWIEISSFKKTSVQKPSPSMRREWIEIDRPAVAFSLIRVSLHAEGVD